MDNFRNMTRELRNRFHEIHTINAGLEQRIQERTEYLTLLNRELDLIASITSNMAEGVCLVRASDTTIAYCNERMELMFGYDAGELLGEPLATVNAASRDLSMVIQACLDQEGLWSGEIRTHRKDRSSFWCHASVSSYRHDLHGLVWICTMLDISDRKALESELRLSNYSIESSSEAVFWMDRDGKVVRANKAACSLLGYTSEEIVAKVLPVDLHMGTEWRKSWMVMKSGYPLKVEQVITRATDGRNIPVGITAHHVAVDGREYCCAVAFDLTEQKAMVAQLEAARHAAEAANKAKTSFLANMSHEIRTPLNGVVGMGQLLAMTSLDPEQQQYVETIMLSAENLMSLITDVLDLSKVEADMIKLEASTFSLRRAIEDVLRMQQSRIHTKGLKIIVDIAEDVPQAVVGDEMRIKQILLNLLTNAIKFTEEGSIAFCATARSGGDDLVHVEVTVQDTGIGISPQMLEQIFLPFVQGDNSVTRKYGGTGLGITISRRLAELMGGSLGVVSTEGTGTTFRLLLPLRIGEVAMPPRPRPSSPAELWDGPPLHVLLAEDNEINRQFAATLLGKMGHTVVSAANGREALDLLERKRFDLVLMDVQIPELTGIQVVRAVREREQATGEHLPFIALTAFAMKGEKDRFLAQGFDSYISKPLEVQKLASEMRRMAVREQAIAPEVLP